MAEGVVVTSVVDKVIDSMFVVAKKEIGYMWNYKQYVEKYRSEVQKLKDMKGRIQQKIELAKNKGDNLVHGVEDWVNAAAAEILKAEEFITDVGNAKKTCFGIGVCGNWRTLHHYGKKATEIAPLMELQGRGTVYDNNEIAIYTPAPQQLDVYQKKNLDGIITQNSALGDIITAIKDESIQIIGIYGVGGVGKTTLAMEVAARVKNIFAAVAFTTISQTVDANKVKSDTEIATKRMMKGEKVLIILDDVWEELNLDELCIPCGFNHMSCKILLTSRSEDVCVRMNAQSKICVNSLPLKEAWILFKHVVGDKVEIDINLKSVAMEVANECGGLPLMLNVIGNTLKNKDVHLWKAALTQLQKNAPVGIDPSIRKAFTRLKLSYDYLGNEEAQWCFLQCSMFPEDYKILLEDLVHYRVGLEKFKELESMEDARSRVQNSVNILKSCSLLMDVDVKFKPSALSRNAEFELAVSKYYVKMHDVVRDVALLIATTCTDDFLVKAGKGLREWLPRNNIPQNYTGISLIHNYIYKLPEYSISFPHLEALHLQSNRLSSISDEFIEGMKNVRVLNLAFNKISSLPQSLAGLSKLRMLNLSGNKSLCDISVLGELKGIEILILNKTGIKEVPECIGQLINIRRLELRECVGLSYTIQGVILNLLRLEELCIDFGIDSNGIHEFLVEVSCLSKLTCLRLRAPSVNDIPEALSFQKLKGFDIQIGTSKRYWGFRKPVIVEYTWTSERHLTLKVDYLVFPFLKWMKNLIEVSRPNITLNEIENLNNIVPDLYREVFNHLEYIKLVACHNVTCLVDRYDGEGSTKEKFLMEVKDLRLEDCNNLKVLWNCPDEFISLPNLVILHIHQCRKLVRLFPVSVAQGLISLKELHIEDCHDLEEVIWGEAETAAKIIVFPCLTNIRLSSLHELKNFYTGSCTIKYPSLVKLSVDSCYMETWGPGIHETPNLKFVDDVPLDGTYSIDEAMVKSVQAWLSYWVKQSLELKPPVFRHEL
ncbi:probable disease resistance protein At4g27220 [Rutidosis leptorrhynchoides]|uniref:probable disease resistance protein At4g27220 n=1 Tax=Rutidosis leptorrhynchoides TaxID=125765 RepID=UPI003A9A1001